jgi:hypothetical protein
MPPTRSVVVDDIKNDAALMRLGSSNGDAFASNKIKQYKANILKKSRIY